MDIKNLLFELCNENSLGTLEGAAALVEKELSNYCEVSRKGNTVIGTIKGDGDYTLMLDAHIDEVGFVVTSVSSDGFLAVKNAGGIDPRILPATPVIIHGKEKVTGVFCSTPPHLKSGEQSFESAGDFKIDTLLGENAKDIVSIGDYVTFSSKPIELLGEKISSKSLDDRAGVVCLIELARRISGRKLPFNVVFLISDMEELGLRGARTASFKIDPDIAIAIDVSFGTAPDVSDNEGGALGGGAMIGIAPTLSSDISKSLINIAKENDIPYQLEAMGGSSGTNADAISISKGGVKTGLLSIPLRNMHTSNEVIDLNDIRSVCDILEKYIAQEASK